MAILDDDVRLYQSLVMTDDDDGGGRPSAVVVLDGVDNNVFPDVTDIQRAAGIVHVRKLFGAVTSANADAYMSAHFALTDVPDDAGTSCVMWRHGGYTTQRAEAVAALFGAPFGLATRSDGSGGRMSAPLALTWTGGGTSFDGGSAWDEDYTGVATWMVFDLAGVLYIISVVRNVFGFWNAVGVTLPGSGPQGAEVRLISRPSGSSRCYGAALSAAGAASGATGMAVGSTWAQVIPVGPGEAYPASDDPGWQVPSQGVIKYTRGAVPIILPRDLALVHHTNPAAPQTVANGQTVNVGRTALARLRVIGATGVEHARFTRGVTPSAVGCIADLDAGTITFTNVSGMVQPVVIEDRIEALMVVASCTTTAVTFTQALARTYPAGTVVSSLARCGDLQARAYGGFAQQAWTGVWSDAPIGGQPSGDYNDVLAPVTVTNEGAITERWAFEFTNTTTFRCWGETVGTVGTGNTSADFSPINPVTGVPFFTVPAIGWGGSGWAQGNVYRRNTRGALAPVWELRCVVPSPPGSTDSATIELRGSVNT